MNELLIKQLQKTQMKLKRYKAHIGGFPMKFIRKDVARLAVPIFAEQVFVMSLGMINTMMAGHIGKEAVSAIGMVDSINNIFIAFFSALAIGGTVVVAQYIGQKNLKMANAALKQALYTGLLLSIIITFIAWIFRGQLIGLLFGLADRKVIADAYIYLGITLLTYPLITMDLISNGILRGSGDSKTPMKITMFMNVINVILSYLFIYGIQIKDSYININIHGMGIKGAAFGIAIARSTGAIIILSILLRGTKSIKLTRVLEFAFNKELLKPIYSIGIPASVESLLFNGGKLITQIFIVGMGTVSIAANAITGSIANMLNTPGIALSTTATALVGQQMGRGKSDKAQGSLSYLTKVSSICQLILALLSIPFARGLASLYTTNVDIIQLTKHLLWINALFIPLWSISFILPAGLKGAGDAKYTMVTTMIGMWVFRITLGYLLGVSLKFGLIGVWLGMYVDWLVRGILYYIRFKSGKWKQFVIIKKNSLTN